MRVQIEVDRGPSVNLFPAVFTFCSLNHDIGFINNAMMQKPSTSCAYLKTHFSHPRTVQHVTFPAICCGLFPAQIKLHMFAIITVL
jgi:hypothetical protein